MVDGRGKGVKSSDACIMSCISWKSKAAFLNLKCKLMQNMLHKWPLMLQWGLSVNANIVSNAASEVSVLYSVWHEFLHPAKQKIAPVISDTLKVWGTPETYKHTQMRTLITTINTNLLRRVTQPLYPRLCRENESKNKDERKSLAIMF